MSEEPTRERPLDGLPADKDQAPDQPAVPEPPTEPPVVPPPVEASVDALGYDSAGEVSDTCSLSLGETVTISCCSDTTVSFSTCDDSTPPVDDGIPRLGITNYEISEDEMTEGNDPTYFEFRNFEPLDEDKSPDFSSQDEPF